MGQQAQPADSASTTGSREFPTTVTPLVLLGAVLWTLSIVFFVGQAIAIAALSRPYSLTTNLISDLGNTACGAAICSPLHDFVNATFVLAGLCHALGALATYRVWPRVRFGRFGACLLVIAGAGLILAGLSPENVDPSAHATGALVGLIALNLAMLAYGWSLLPVRRWLGRLTLGAGIVGLVGTGYFLAGRGLPGLSERIADYPSAVMVVVLGVAMLVSLTLRRRSRLSGVG